MSEMLSLSNPNVLLTTEALSQHIGAQDFYSWAKSLDVGSDRTIETYSRNILRFSEYLNINGITKPTRNDVIAFRDELKESKKPSTVHGYMVAVKLFFKWTEEQGIYPDIAKNVKNVSVPVTFKKEPLTVNQVKELLQQFDKANINSVRDFALVLLMVTTGLREVSIMQANIGDISTKAVDEPGSDRVFYKDILFYKSKGHDDKDLFVILPPETKAAIDEYIQYRASEGSKTTPDSPLFTSLSNHNNDGRLSTRSIRRIATNYLKMTDIDLSRISTHSLRHSFATINILSGGSIEETQKALGHRNISTTMIYNHAITETNNQSTTRVADAIFG